MNKKSTLYSGNQLKHGETPQQPNLLPDGMTIADVLKSRLREHAIRHGDREAPESRPTQIRITTRDLKMLKMLQPHTGLSTSDVVRELLHQYIESNKHLLKQAAQYAEDDE
jgi:hypothetical protein